MAITKERFEQGMSYEEYKAQMTRNRERLESNEKFADYSADDLAYFANLREPVNALVLAEDWCGDVLNNLPVVAKVAAESGKINLRIFLRDQNLDIMDQYLKEGQFRSIPVIALFDANFNDLGHWIERPQIVNKMQAAMRKELFANDPLFAQYTVDTPFGDLSEEARARLGQAFGKFREENRTLSDHEVVRELRSLVEHGKLSSAESVPAQVASIAKNDSAPTPAINKSERVKVSITYCAECGYDPQTLELTGALMKAFVHELSAIEILPWQDGAFDVHVNGDLVHSMYRDGGFPENETIIQAVRTRLA